MGSKHVIHATDLAFYGSMYLVILAVFVVSLPFKRHWKKATQFGIEL
jgi:hypothetical protein